MRGKEGGASTESGERTRLEAALLERRGDGRASSAQQGPPFVAQRERLFELMLDLVCVATADGHFTYLNPAWERVLGYSTAELMAAPILHWVHPDDIPDLHAAFAQLAAGSACARFENRYRCRDGSYKWLEWNTVPDPATGHLYGFAREISESKQHEERLRAREQQLADAQMLAGVGSWGWNVETSELTCSEQALALLGVAPEHAGGSYDFIMQAVHPDDYELVDAALQNLLRDGTSYAIEYRVIRANGLIHTLSGRGRSISAGGAQPRRLIGTLQDITERKRAEDESRLLANTAHALNTAEDLSSALAITLKQVCESEGWDYGEFWFPGPDSQELVCHVASYAKKPDRLREFRLHSQRRTCAPDVTLPGRVYSRNQAEWHADLSGANDDVFCRAALARSAQLRTCVGVPLRVEGKVAAVLVLLRHSPSVEDSHQLAVLSTVAAQLGILIHRRQTEDALRRSEERFQIAARATSDLIYDWNLVTNALWLSEAATRNFGHTNTTPPIGWWLDLIHPDDAERIHAALEQAISGTTTLWSGEYRFRRADGSYANVFDRGYISRDPGGQALRMIGSMLDISEREQNAAALREAKESAEAAARAKSQFLANMSHEIRTPLTAVLGFADLLLDAKLSDSDRLNYVMTIRRNGEHLLSVLNDILDLSKVEAGKMAVELIKCSPAQVLNDVAALMRVRAVEKGLAFEVTYDGMIPATLRTDPTRLRQIVLNLVSNAIKFTEQGSVVLTARCEALDEGRAELTVSVRDTGIGMDEAQRSRLFQPFSQADTSMTRRYGGSGLGLGISAPLAAALGGSIAVESEPGRGSTFTLRVPVWQVPGSALLQRPEEGLARDHHSSIPTLDIVPRAGGRVLLAEDGRDNQVLIGTLLRKHGFEVQVVENGRLAVERTLDALESGRPFHVVLMDMQMPELDGYGATSQLRARGYSGTIVALTAHALSGERERCLSAGCDDYLTKPIERASLIASVKTYVRKNRSSPPPATPSMRSGPPGFAQRGGREPLISLFAHDPDLAEIVAGFVRGLPVQIAALVAAGSRGDRGLLIRLAHQLKGAAGGYGFPSITEAADHVESLAKTDDEFLQQALNELVERCERAQLGRHEDASPSLLPEPGSAPRILAIDDSPQVQELIAARLRAEHVVIVQASNAADGLRLASEQPPDLVLLDLDLPDASGLDVCRALQGDPKTSGIPVLFLTGTNDPAIKAAALDLGAIDYVTKPFDATELRARVRSALRTKRYQDLLATRAQVDGLTGLWNRAHFDARLSDEVAAATRHGRPLALIMIDIDHFKHINDTYGHPFGDQVLQAVAGVLGRTVRASDLVCRYGGEEFVAILRETNAEAAVLSAQRLRAALAKLTLSAKGKHIQVTVSFGVAALEPPYHDKSEELSASVLVGAADAALYQAKRRGRDQVVLGELE
jgi:diguanylate cyclase (GGDEF)-like protein/PAS domain S-box-containing protein